MKKKGFIILPMFMFGSMLMLLARIYTTLKIRKSRFLAFSGLVFLTFFGTGAAHAATYTSPSDSNRTYYITVQPGIHTFIVTGISSERYTEWYVNGSFTGDTDHSWFGNGYSDPQFSYSFSSGTTQIEARVYDGDWNYLEYHRWQCTVSLPDLVVSYVQPHIPPSGGKYYVGDSIDWEVRVQNTGDGDADYSYVGYYLGSSPSDISHQINEDSTSPLASGQWEIDQDMYEFQLSDVGYPLYLICKADRTNRVDEENENNNTNYYGPFEIASSCPSAPTGVSASDGTYPDKVRITWNLSSGATYYQVWRGIEDLPFMATKIADFIPNSPYDDYTIPPGTPYFYWVKAADSACGPSEFSSSDSGYTSCSVPSTPAGVSASDGTICNQIYITWNPSSGVDEYRVYRDGSPESDWQSGTNYTDGPGDCSTHTYQVEAQNSCGSSGLGSGDTGHAMCAPVITLDPVQYPDPVCDGNDVTFTVVATGDSLHYQWKVDGVNIGFDNPSYLWEGVSFSDDGTQVVCEVWNDCDIVNSNATTLNVDNCVGPIAHQCDSDSDWRILISEITLYGFYWQTGQDWPVGPNPIPIDYVTNAGYLWTVGECYDYNDLETPPHCWQPFSCGISSGDPVSWNFNPSNYTAESHVEISIEITPNPETLVYAVEDSPATGWMVDSINESGIWDDINKKVTWGPFLDANVRTLTYNATPPAGETGVKTFSGTASFDGSNEPFFRNIFEECPLGNLDDDCGVNFIDFSIFANHWLEGVK